MGTDPIKIGIGTAVLAAIVHLDGSGAVTFLICVPALLPLYDALGMRRTTLATIVALSAGTMNILPWGGPTIRAHTALATMEGTEATVTEFFMPVLPSVLAGMVCVLLIAAFLGSREKKRIGAVALQAVGHTEQELTDEQKALLRPHLFSGEYHPYHCRHHLPAVLRLCSRCGVHGVLRAGHRHQLPPREGLQGPCGRPRQGSPS